MKKRTGAENYMIYSTVYSNEGVKTNIGRQFLKLIRKHSTKHHNQSFKNQENTSGS